LNAAFFRDRRLFDGVHLSLHLGEFGGSLLVATNQKCSRPKHDDGRRRGDRIVGSLLILRAG
jgi:hypothetical protein